MIKKSKKGPDFNDNFSRYFFIGIILVFALLFVFIVLSNFYYIPSENSDMKEINEKKGIEESLYNTFIGNPVGLFNQALSARKIISKSVYLTTVTGNAIYGRECETDIICPSNRTESNCVLNKLIKREFYYNCIEGICIESSVDHLKEDCNRKMCLHSDNPRNLDKIEKVLIFRCDVNIDQNACILKEKSCNDKKACTDDFCKELICDNDGRNCRDAECKNEVNCNKGNINLCINNVCDKIGNCIVLNKDCHDHNICTENLCMTDTGKCFPLLLKNCIPGEGDVGGGDSNGDGWEDPPLVIGGGGDGDEPCIPDCRLKMCGDDSCGGECPNQCLEGQFCMNGDCTNECQPKCIGKTCGDDSCGGLCGVCPSGQTCNIETGSCCVSDWTIASECKCVECEKNLDCKPGKCVQGKCAPECVEDLDCLKGKICECPNGAGQCDDFDKKCIDKCTPKSILDSLMSFFGVDNPFSGIVSDCSEFNKECYNGRCVYECESDSECLNGQICKENKCITKVNRILKNYTNILSDATNVCTESICKLNSCICPYTDQEKISDSCSCKCKKPFQIILNKNAPCVCAGKGQFKNRTGDCECIDENQRINSKGICECIELDQKIIEETDGTLKCVCKNPDQNMSDFKCVCNDKEKTKSFVGILDSICECKGGETYFSTGNPGILTGDTIGESDPLFFSDQTKVEDPFGKCICKNGQTTKSCLPRSITPNCTILQTDKNHCAEDKKAACSCTPKTCDELGYTCGQFDDTCGNLLNCGQDFLCDSLQGFECKSNQIFFNEGYCNKGSGCNLSKGKLTQKCKECMSCNDGKSDEIIECTTVPKDTSCNCEEKLDLSSAATPCCLAMSEEYYLETGENINDNSCTCNTLNSFVSTCEKKIDMECYITPVPTYPDLSNDDDEMFLIEFFDIYHRASELENLEDIYIPTDEEIKELENPDINPEDINLLSTKVENGILEFERYIERIDSGIIEVNLEEGGEYKYNAVVGLSQLYKVGADLKIISPGIWSIDLGQNNEVCNDLPTGCIYRIYIKTELDSYNNEVFAGWSPGYPAIGNVNNLADEYWLSLDESIIPATYPVLIYRGRFIPYVNYIKSNLNVNNPLVFLKANAKGIPIKEDSPYLNKLDYYTKAINLLKTEKALSKNMNDQKKYSEFCFNLAMFYKLKEDLNSVDDEYDDVINSDFITDKDIKIKANLFKVGFLVEKGGIYKKMKLSGMTEYSGITIDALEHSLNQALTTLTEARIRYPDDEVLKNQTRFLQQGFLSMIRSEYAGEDDKEWKEFSNKYSLTSFGSIYNNVRKSCSAGQNIFAVYDEFTKVSEFNIRKVDGIRVLQAVLSQGYDLDNFLYKLNPLEQDKILADIYELEDVNEEMLAILASHSKIGSRLYPVYYSLGYKENTNYIEKEREKYIIISNEGTNEQKDNYHLIQLMKCNAHKASHLPDVSLVIANGVYPQAQDDINHVYRTPANMNNYIENEFEDENLWVDGLVPGEIYKDYFRFQTGEGYKYQLTSDTWVDSFLTELNPIDLLMWYAPATKVKIGSRTFSIARWIGKVPGIRHVNKPFRAVNLGVRSTIFANAYVKSGITYYPLLGKMGLGLVRIGSEIGTGYIANKLTENRLTATLTMITIHHNGFFKFTGSRYFTPSSLKKILVNEEGEMIQQAAFKNGVVRQNFINKLNDYAVSQRGTARSVFEGSNEIITLTTLDSESKEIITKYVITSPNEVVNTIFGKQVKGYFKFSRLGEAVRFGQNLQAIKAAKEARRRGYVGISEPSEITNIGNFVYDAYNNLRGGTNPVFLIAEDARNNILNRVGNAINLVLYDDNGKLIATISYFKSSLADLGYFPYEIGRIASLKGCQMKPKQLFKLMKVVVNEFDSKGITDAPVVSNIRDAAAYRYIFKGKNGNYLLKNNPTFCKNNNIVKRSVSELTTDELKDLNRFKDNIDINDLWYKKIEKDGKIYYLQYQITILNANDVRTVILSRSLE